MYCLFPDGEGVEDGGGGGGGGARKAERSFFVFHGYVVVCARAEFGHERRT